MANKPTHTQPNTTKSKQPLGLVVMLHGLHQNPWFVHPFARALRKLGFLVHCFGYYSLKDDINTHAHRLHQYLTAIHQADIPIHLVGHSLGGLVIRNFLHIYPNWQIGRVVTLGTPHLGSTCASYIKHFFPLLIGHAYHHALDGDMVPLPEHINLGVIAGNKSFGLGKPVLYVHQTISLTQNDWQNDGTVYIHETYLPTAKDHIILPVTHMGLLHNKSCIQQTAHFLQHGQFFRT